MDKIDEQILSFLSENARTKISYIAKKIHLSETSVIERVKKLENSGVIRQYTTVVDPEKLGLDITTFTYIRIEHPKYNEDFIKQMQESFNFLPFWICVPKNEFCYSNQNS